MNLDELLTKLERLESEATGKKWFVGDIPYYRQLEYEYNNMDGVGPVRSPVVCGGNHDDLQLKNLELAVELRNAAPMMIKLLREWKKALEYIGNYPEEHSLYCSKQAGPLKDCPFCHNLNQSLQECARKALELLNRTNELQSRTADPK